MSAFRSVHVPWRVKAMLFRALDVMPAGPTMYYRLQKHVTRTVPRRLAPTVDTASCFIDHAAAMRAEWGHLAPARVFEFGAGWDLYGNLVLWCYGLNDQVVYDLVPLARPAEINAVISHLAADPPPGALRVPKMPIATDASWTEDLRQRYGITYIAPGDAMATPFADGHFDAIVTTSVLEHLPPAAIDAVLAETRRILRPGGLMLHAIDYSDHYAHSDAAIGHYNFLRFSANQWARFSPAIHYQNRLRHDDYARAFDRAGLQPLRVRTHVPGNAADEIAAVALHPAFGVRPLDVLTPIFGYFVLTNPGSLYG